MGREHRGAYTVRILLVAPPWLSVPPLRYGGIEWVVSGLADGLTDAGHEVTLVASGGSVTRAQLDVVFSEPPFEQLGDARIETIQALAAYRCRDDFDIIHDHTAAVGPALGAVAVGPPVVHTLHHAWLDEQIRLARLIAPPVRLVAISHDQAARSPDDVPITAVVHNGVPVDRYPFTTDKDDYLLFVGRANRDKGPEVAIEVARRLGRPLVMAMKTNEPPERAYWREVLQPMIATDPTQINLVPNPNHERKVALMARAAAVVVPIQWAEPCGLVMPEANACGTPVVAFDMGAAREVIAHGKTGFVVPPGDLDAFCGAVEQTKDLLPDDCRTHVVERFSVQRMVADYERVYEAVSTIDLRTPDHGVVVTGSGRPVP
jgi:glycosyltransferase involved in cell wall biosynthesis